ncbi:MAG: alanine racemase [Moraxellaceae bacterium]|nr:MAG: alanine racemase [Moraxellaceae bacterium]
MSRGTCAVIDLAALRQNYQVIKQQAGTSQILAIVKADGYGHGMTSIARALPESDGFGVAILEEALLLRAAGITQKILMLEGALSLDEMQQAGEAKIDVVVHQLEQVAFVEQIGSDVSLNVWLKVDTGMHRLGLEPEDVQEAYRRLQACGCVRSMTLMSHFSCADDVESPVSDRQYQRFEQLHNQHGSAELDASLANSAGIFRDKQYHYQWVRPGIALYGGSPIAGQAAEALGLLPVMTLKSRVIALKVVAQGENVGYGARWTASAETKVAIVAIGYGDGYPRHMGSATKVLINDSLCSVIGRVSMDMIAVDVSAADVRGADVSRIRPVALNDSVTLWGKGLPVEIVADWAETINYELLCQVTDRVDHRYLDVKG